MKFSFTSLFVNGAVVLCFGCNYGVVRLGTSLCVFEDLHTGMYVRRAVDS